MLVNIPIESLEERYSAQWNRWFPEEFNRHHVLFHTVEGAPLSNKITQGAFLDVISTNHFKASQLQDVTRLLWRREVGDGDTFFFHDLWFPGLEMLAYIRDGLDLDFSICGIMHAGSYDPFDFLTKKGMGRWAEELEKSWLRLVDRVFVATHFHRDLLISQRLSYDTALHDKIVVTGLPMYPAEFVQPGVEKENIVVFPHRLDREKNPQLFEELAGQYARSGWDFIRSKDVTSNKQEYYDLLNRAKIAVSFADQETWGIAQMEALFCGCIPIVPDRLSYHELYPEPFRYDSTAHAFDKIGMLIHSSQAFEAYRCSMEGVQKRLRDIVEQAIPRMLREMECI